MNRLFYGDNLDVMRKFIRPICIETVDLCYIDPPFNSKRNYNQIYNNMHLQPKPRRRSLPTQRNVITDYLFRSILWFGESFFIRRKSDA